VLELAQLNGINSATNAPDNPKDADSDIIIDIIADLRDSGILTMAEAIALTLSHIRDDES
jgi:hypothetical protein